jgi:hypothetical protein
MDVLVFSLIVALAVCMVYGLFRLILHLLIWALHLPFFDENKKPSGMAPSPLNPIENQATIT